MSNAGTPSSAPPGWALPGELAAPGSRRRRTLRDWLVDTALFGFALVWWAWGYADFVADPDPEYTRLVADWMIAVDPWVGVAACLALWWRRRFPLAIAIAMVPTLAIAATGTGAVLVSIFTLAVHRSWLPATLVTAAQLTQGVGFSLAYQPADLPVPIFTGYITAMFLVPLGWGIAVRARRQLILSLRRDARREQEAQQRRLDEARQAERARIAREMHDVLAHRISLLSVHAGALAYRSSQAQAGAAEPLAPAEVAGAVQVIRDNAHDALTELGEVLAVLRAGEPRLEAARPAPQPQLGDLPRLVAEARAAGQPVALEVDPVVARVPLPRLQEQRTAYRVAQEGLTNARKHAPDAQVGVRVGGAPGQALEVSVVNPLPPGATAAEIPGAGAGLVGLAERVSLDGGELRHGVVDGEFQLTARLPWPAPGPS